MGYKLALIAYVFVCVELTVVLAVGCSYGCSESISDCVPKSPEPVPGLPHYLGLGWNQQVASAVYCL